MKEFISISITPIHPTAMNLLIIYDVLIVDGKRKELAGKNVILRFPIGYLSMGDLLQSLAMCSVGLETGRAISWYLEIVMLL